jgi:hypothetical protein
VTGKVEANEVVAAILDAGYPASKSILRRWHREGVLLALPKQGPGRVRLYKGSAINQGIAAAYLLKRKRNLAWVGWNLWLSGFEVAERCWKRHLSAVAMRADRVTQRWRGVSDGDDENALGRFINKLCRVVPGDKFLGVVRRSLGEDRFREAMALILDLGAGLFDDISSRPELTDPERLRAARVMDLALGLRDARADHFEGDPPLISGDYSNVLRGLSQRLAASKFKTALASATAMDMDSARSELVRLMNTLAAMYDAMARRGEKRAFGLHRIRAIWRKGGMDLEALLLLGWLIYRKESGVADRVQEIFEAAEARNLRHGQQSTAVMPPLRHTRVVFPFEEWAVKQRQL